jgi:uncharacterized protein
MIIMGNHLSQETSPYLLQHSQNPVEWYPWIPEALERARNEAKPIFLSIGYAACHWCHVMAHESFEDPETAHILNQHFISIKVDREERPDLDSIYMDAVVSMTGQGGWPMSIFLTPDGKPFYGGTYFPPTRRYGSPSFKEVLTAVIRAWNENHGEVLSAADQMTEHLTRSFLTQQNASDSLPEDLCQTAFDSLRSHYDWTNGGWGGAPKFPAPMVIEFLLQQATRGNQDALKIAAHNLDALAKGGMYDLVGGGFHRYSTDDAWRIPHFEKMLYDNAQLALVYLHAYLITRDPAYRSVTEDTLNFIQRELADPSGGFFSSLDADSEGQEGKFYTWTTRDVQKLLPQSKLADVFFHTFESSDEGNFDGAHVLQKKAPDEEIARELALPLNEFRSLLREALDALSRARSARIRPGTDDKVIVSWNAFTLQAFSEAARYLNRPDYLESARKNATFLLAELHPSDRLLRSWRKGSARHNAYLEDYAALIIALYSLYQSDPDLHWYNAAGQLAEELVENFSDPQGGFFNTRKDHEALVVRPKEIQDNATPSGNSLAAYALLVSAAFTGSDQALTAAQKTLSLAGSLPAKYPTAFGNWLQAFDFWKGPISQIAVVSPPQSRNLASIIELIWKNYRPRMVFAWAEFTGRKDLPPLLLNRPLKENRTTVYICQDFVCKLPVNSEEELISILK